MSDGVGQGRTESDNVGQGRVGLGTSEPGSSRENLRWCLDDAGSSRIMSEAHLGKAPIAAVV